jgi:hypothetical protein
MTENEYITQLEDRCHSMAAHIITRLCKKAMCGMNQLEASLIGSTDAYPKNFKFIDILSIELQDRIEEEINPSLEDYIRTTLEEEQNNLSAEERFVLEQAYLDYNYEVDYDEIARQIRSRFHELLNEHYELKKIQNFIERR